MRLFERLVEKKLSLTGEVARPVSYAGIPVEYVILRRDPSDTGSVYVGGSDGYPLNPGDSIRLDNVKLSEIEVYVPGGVTANIYILFKNKPMSIFELSRLAPRRGLVAEYLFELMGSDTRRLVDTSGYGRHGTISGAMWKQLTNGKWYLEFDGVDDYVVIEGTNTPTHPMKPQNGLIAAVHRLAGPTGDAQNVFRAGLNGWVCGWSDSGYSSWRVWVNDNVSWKSIVVATPSDIEGKWVMTALAFKANDRMRGYLNMELKGEQSIGTIRYDPGYVHFGCSGESTPFFAFLKGSIAIAWVFDITELTWDEVDDLVAKLYDLARILVPLG